MARNPVTIAQRQACSAVMTLTAILRLLTSIDSLNLLHAQCDVTYGDP